MSIQRYFPCWCIPAGLFLCLICLFVSYFHIIMEIWQMAMRFVGMVISQPLAAYDFVVNFVGNGMICCDTRKKPPTRRVGGSSDYCVAPQILQICPWLTVSL